MTTYGRKFSAKRSTAPYPTSGLAGLWIADSGVTLTSGKVSQWNDQSGNGNHVTQANAALRPTVTAAAIGGKDAITFGGSTVLFTANAVVAHGQPRTAVAVVRPAGTGGTICSFRTAGVASLVMLWNLSGNTWVYTDVVANAAGMDGDHVGLSPVAVECELTVGIAPVYRINAVEQTIVTRAGDGLVHDDTGGSPTFMIGNYYVGDIAFDNQIAALFIYNRILGASDYTRLRSYLTGYYGVP